MYTAIKEPIEEFTQFSKPHASGLFFGQLKEGVGTVEFIALMFVGCYTEQVEQIIQDNRAQGFKEHTK